MQAARQTFFDSGFPVCIDFSTSLASTCKHFCNRFGLCQHYYKKMSMTNRMIKQRIKIRVVGWFPDPLLMP